MKMYISTDYRGTSLGKKGKETTLRNLLYYPSHNQLYIRKALDWKICQLHEALLKNE